MKLPKPKLQASFLLLTKNFPTMTCNIYFKQQAEVGGKEAENGERSLKNKV